MPGELIYLVLNMHKAMQKLFLKFEFLFELRIEINLPIFVRFSLNLVF